MPATGYDDSPGAARQPLTLDDVDHLLVSDGRSLAGDGRRVRHLLSRVRATLSSHLDQVRALQRDVESLTRQGGGGLETVRELLGQLTLKQQAELYDQRGRALLAAVEDARSDVERARTLAASEVNKARFVLGALIDDVELPVNVRQQLASAMDTLPPAQPHRARPTPALAGGFSVTAADDLGAVFS